jgi:hypothetical protein
VDVIDFVARYPRLYHLAHGDAWPNLQRHGLLSAAGLVRLFEVPDAGSLLAQRRPEAEALTHPVHGTATLRDQKPLNEAKLASALTEGVTVSEWLDLLSRLAFFFPGREGRDPDGLQKMLAVYGHEPVVVLTVDTSSLVRDYEASILLSHINTGATYYAPAPRGRDTFLSIRRYDHAKRRTVKEVAVPDGVPNLLDHLHTAERRLPDGTKDRLDGRDSSTPGLPTSS